MTIMYVDINVFVNENKQATQDAGGRV